VREAEPRGFGRWMSTGTDTSGAPRMSFLDADDTQSIEKLDRGRVHLPAEGRSVGTSAAPEDRPHAPATLEAQEKGLQGETHAEV